MKSRSLSCSSAIVVFGLACTACSHPPGHVEAGFEAPRPEEVLDFAALYSQNCAGCHGKNGRGGAAIPLANPVYLAASGEIAVRKAVANGVAGTLMPPFEQSAGGNLTKAQVDDLVQGLLREWGSPDALAGTRPPPYASGLKGNPVQGQKSFAEFCGRCHGPGGAGVQTSHIDTVPGSIIDSSYLALVSDQSLRSTIIAGRPDEGMPDWRGDIVGRPMTDQEITDVAAWLATFRRIPQ